MPRSSGKSSSRSSSSRTSTATSTPPRASPPAVRPSQQPVSRPATQQTHQHPPAQQPHHPPPVQQAPSAGSGMLANVGSAVAGSFLGNVIANKMMGGGNDASQPQQAAPQQQMYANQPMYENPCAQFQMTFGECLRANPYDISACQMTFDQWNNCKLNNNDV
eukprot:TRINITY_DN511_c0_g2_i1.p1 TRINITY_DN511_c0_g2~~TRINITY_DN511_c0_g2_i1.p1  ORF type:complete len:162 (+),score=19.03 TRINITY_DN511_c0_g2_i1:94-579(+)